MSEQITGERNFAPPVPELVFERFQPTQPYIPSVEGLNVPNGEVNTVSAKRFIFVMKAIAENNLWDDVLLHFEERGHAQIQVFAYMVDLLKEALNEKVRAGEALNKRGQRFLMSATCGSVGGGGPTRPPVSPGGGGSGGGDAGAGDGGHPQ